MALPSSGPIDLGSIQTEFGGVNPIGINEYYRNGGLVPSNNTNVPTSGTISLADFYGAINEIIKYITTTSTNVNASSYFTAGEWASSAPKRLIINSGVTVGATNTSNYALNIPSGFSGTFRLVNNGTILGAGGAANSGTGGNAIFAGAAISIDNQGTIYSGGGGGGIGGVGGTGGQGSFTTVTDIGEGYTGCVNPANCNQPCYNRFGFNVNITCKPGFCGTSFLPGCLLVSCGMCVQSGTGYSSGGAGGAGGNGGRGQGYDGAAASGLGGAGGAAGGTNAGVGGTGGTGGTGGAYGTSGGTGNTGGTGASGNYTAGSAGAGGTGGGLSGFYVVNNGNVTWITTGTRAGRVG